MLVFFWFGNYHLKYVLLINIQLGVLFLKNFLFVISVIFLLQGVFAGEVSNSYGDPGDAYLIYSISGPDFSADIDSPTVHSGTYTGEPIHFSGKMIVARPEGLKSWVTMKASLADQSVNWPAEGEDSLVENRTVELPFDFTFVVPADYASDTIIGNVRLEVCGGVCGVYNVDLRVSKEKTDEIKPESIIGGIAVEKEFVEEPCVDSGAKFSSISKVVDIFPDSNPDNLRSAKLYSILCVNDHVLTGEESLAWITFADNSTITMKEESEIVISSPPKEISRLEVLKGRLFMNIKKVLAGESIEVKGNWATCGIKGTTFILEENDTNTTIKLIEGVVDFTSNVTGEKKTIVGGETLSATSTGLSEEKAFNISDEKKNWVEVENFEGEQGSILVPIAILLIIVIVAVGVFIFINKNKK